MHPELERQLREYFGWDAEAAARELQGDAAWSGFIGAVDAAYAQAELDRELLERALDARTEDVLTAHREQQAALTTAHLLKRQSEARMTEVEGILAGAPHPILMTDRAGTVIRASAAVETTLGWRPEDLEGASIATIIPGAFDYWMIRARREHAYSKLRGSGEARTPVTAEFVATRSDGSEVIVEATLVDLEDADGSYRIVVELVDLTARRHAEAQARVLQKSEALGTLVAGVAHDFNNILTIIAGAFAAVAEGAPDHDHWIEVGQRSTDRAIALVASLLRFSRRSPVTTTPFDLSSMAQDAVRMLREMIDRRIILDTSGIETDLPEVVGDPNELQQVLVNLVLNARDAVLQRAAASGGEYRPSIEIRVGRTLAHGLPAAQVEVHDNGGGIPAELIERVFDPFFTTKPVGKGTGLGLSMAHSIVRTHGGEISIDTEPGAGTTVRFWLPVDAPPALTAQPATSTPASPGERDGRAATEDWRVLVVDDEPNLLDLARFVFSRTGAELTTVEDAAQALLAVEQAPFDVALVDVNMPGMDGWQLLERFREVAPDLPVVMVSGYLDAEDVLRHEPVAAVTKPYDARTLLDTVRRVVAEHPRA